MLRPYSDERISMMQRLQPRREDAPLIPFRLRVATNEIGEEVGRAVEVAAGRGIRDVESNTEWGRGVTELSDDGIRHVRNLVLARGLRAHSGRGRAFRALQLDAGTPPSLGPTRDPGDAFVSGEGRPFPDGSAAVRSTVGHVDLEYARIAIVHAPAHRVAAGGGSRRAAKRGDRWEVRR